MGDGASEMSKAVAAAIHHEFVVRLVVKEDDDEAKELVMAAAAAGCLMATERAAKVAEAEADDHTSTDLGFGVASRIAARIRGGGA
jgi:hypothetical protein